MLDIIESRINGIFDTAEDGEQSIPTSLYRSRGTFRIAPGLIPAFDPNNRNHNATASSLYELIFPPDSTKQQGQRTDCKRSTQFFFEHLELPYRSSLPVFL